MSKRLNKKSSKHNKLKSKNFKLKYKIPKGVFKIYGDSLIHDEVGSEKISEHRTFYWLLEALIRRIKLNPSNPRSFNTREVKLLLSRMYPNLATVILRYINLRKSERDLIMKYRPLNNLVNAIEEFATTIENKINLLKSSRPALVLKSMKLFRRIILIANRLTQENKAYMEQKREQEIILDILDTEVPGIKYYVLSQMEVNIEVPVYMRSDAELSRLYTETIVKDLLNHRELSKETNLIQYTLPEDLEETIKNKKEKSNGNYLNLVGKELTDRDKITRHPLVGSEIVREKLKGLSNEIIANKLGLDTEDINKFWKYYTSLSSAAQESYNKRNVFNWHARLEEHFNDLWEQIENLEEYTEDNEVNELAQDLCLSFMEEILNTLDSYQKILATVANSSSNEIFSYYIDKYLHESVPVSKLPNLLNKLNDYQRNKLV